MKQYMVIYSGAVRDVEDQVNMYILKGYIPCGGLSSLSTGASHMYFQAIYKPADEPAPAVCVGSYL